ncbi:MAG: DUF1778 domain-containing protein [Cellulomonadaceae bacterium]
MGSPHAEQGAGREIVDRRPAKSQRIEVRATPRQEIVLRQAAAATERTLTDFILASAVEQAERVLADRWWFTSTPDQHEQFLRVLAEPLTSADRFARLWSRQPPSAPAREAAPDASAAPQQEGPA